MAGITVFALLAVNLSVQAATPPKNKTGPGLSTSAVNATSTDANINKQQRLAGRCAKWQKQLALIVARHNNNKERYLNLFLNLQNRLSRIVQKLEVEGIDVSDLKADLVVLNQKIEKFRTDYAAYSTKIADTGDLNCSETGVNNPIRTGLKNSRALLKTLQKDILDVRTYYQTVIRKDLQALKDEVKALKKPSITGNENSAGNREATSTATSTP